MSTRRLTDGTIENAKVICMYHGWSCTGRVKAVTEDGRYIVETKDHKAYLISPKEVNITMIAEIEEK